MDVFGGHTSKKWIYGSKQKYVSDQDFCKCWGNETITYDQKCSMCEEFFSEPDGPQCDINNEKYVQNDFQWNMDLHGSRNANY